MDNEYPTSRAPGTLSILLADTDPAERAMLGEQLQAIFPGGFLHVVSTANGALAAANQHPFDVVLLDLHLADIDGLDTADKLRARHNALCPAIVLLSGHESEGLMHQCERRGFGCAAKTSLSIVSLAKTVENALARRVASLWPGVRVS
ncbi:MAG: response regulator [Pseudomonadaceae bacterium]|nr:response regulator [Pseudomonadaceae bacterium]